MASVEYIVKATDAASGVFAKIALSADGLGKQLDELDKRVADPEVKLNDSKFTLGMIRAAERLDKLSEKVADPTVKVDTAKAQVEILRINAMLDRLGAKKVDVTVDVNRSLRSRLAGGFFGLKDSGGGGGGAGIFGLLKNIFGGGASGAAAGGAQGGGALAGQLGPLGIGAAIAAAMAFGPAGIPLGLGALVGGGAAGGALLLGNAAAKKMLALSKSLATAKGPQRAAIEAQMRALQQQNAGPLAVAGAFKDLTMTAKRTFSGALMAPGPGNVLTGAAGPSFLTGLTGILQQVAGFVKSIGPQLGDLFRASLPFISMFAKIMEQMAKALLPAFTQSLKSLTPYLPQLTRAFVVLAQGLADFIKGLGPGMKDSVTVFLGASYLVKGILIVLARGADYTAKFFANFGHVAVDVARFVIDWWDRLEKSAAANLDGMKHAVLAWWDFWVHTWHVIVDAASSAWDLLVKAAKTGIASIVTYFTGLPSRAVRALWGLGHQLAGFASAAMTEMWNGIKSVGSGILGWFGGFVSRITGFFSHLLHHSPTGDFYHMGRNMMEGLAMGLRDHAHLVASSIGAVTGALGGAGTGVQRWAGVALQALRMLGQPSSDLGVVLAQMQTESGGNPVIVNKWDSNWAAGTPSVGLMQVIGPTFGAYAGPFRNVGPFEYGTSVNPLANIYAGLNYAIHRYGPAWTRVLGQGHGYDQGGWLPPGVTLAVNRTGVPERVLPPGSQTGNTYITVQVGHGTHPVAAAQEIVKLLNAGAKSGVKLRTSILGPG